MDFSKLSDEHCCQLAEALEAIGRAKTIIAGLVPEARPAVAAGTIAAHLLGISSPTLDALAAEIARRKCKCAGEDVMPGG